MAKQNLLLVDADLRSLRVLEVSLRKSGYSVATSSDARDALEMMEFSKPDLILCDTRLPHMDGFQFIEELRTRPELADVPLIFLSSDVSVESKVKGLELGVEDYLTKPIYIKEILARVSVVLQRKRREGIELRQTSKQKFTGALSDIGVVDLLQTIDNSKKSGVLHLSSASQRGAIYFRNGNPIDAELGPLQGARAIYRALVWTEGTFEIDFREVRRQDIIQTSTQGILMEGMRRLDEWGRLLEQLPDLDSVFEVSEEQLFARLAEIPDEINAVLRQFDGQRSLMQIVDACSEDDLETLTSVSKLYFEGMVFNTGRHASHVEPAEHADAEARASEPSPDLHQAVVPQPVSPLPPSLEDQWSDVAIGGEQIPAAPTPAPQPRSEPVPKSGSSTRIRAASSAAAPRQSHTPHVPHVPTPKSGDDRSNSLRVRRARKRKKRLSLTTSPGLLSAVDRSSFASDAEAARAVSLDDGNVKLTPSSVAPPSLVLEGSTPAPADSERSTSAPAAATMSKPPPLRRASPPPANGTAPSANGSAKNAPRDATVPLQTVMLTSRRPPVVASAQPTLPPPVAAGPAEASAATPASAQPAAKPANPTKPVAPPKAVGTQTLIMASVSTMKPGVNAKPASLTTLQPSAASRRPDQTTDMHTSPPSLPRNRSSRAVVIALAVGVLGVGAALFSARSSEPAAPARASLSETDRAAAPSEPAPAPPPAPAASEAPPSAETLATAAPPSAAETAPPPASEPAAPAPPPSAAVPAASAAPQPSAEATLARAQKLDEQGKTKQALALYESAAQRMPQNSALLSRLSFAYLNQGRNADAAAYAARAVAAEPSNSEGWIVLGAARDQLGDHKAALESYRKCAELGKGEYVTECKRMLH